MSGLHVDFQISFLSFENLVFAKCLRLTLPVKVCNVSPKLTKLARGSWELKPKQAGQSVGFAQKHILPLAAAVAQSASNAASSLAVCLGGPIPLPSLSSLPVSLSLWFRSGIISVRIRKGEMGEKGPVDRNRSRYHRSLTPMIAQKEESSCANGMLVSRIYALRGNIIGGRLIPLMLCVN